MGWEMLVHAGDWILAVLDRIEGFRGLLFAEPLLWLTDSFDDDEEIWRHFEIYTVVRKSEKQWCFEYKEM